MSKDHTEEEHEWRQTLRLLVEEVLPEFQGCLADAITQTNEKFADENCDDCLQQHIEDAKTELIGDLKKKYSLRDYELFMLGYLERTEEEQEEVKEEDYEN
jgi:ATP-dependent protease HslVU (ClpYQ) peptidase subunit